MKKLSKVSGFTLLELLAVMGIMVVLMSISGAAYYGMSRGAALRGASSNVRSTLSLARQFAATRRSATHVLLWQDATNAYYRTFVRAGVDARSPSLTASTRLYVHGRALAGTDSDLLGAEIFKLTSVTPVGYPSGSVSNNFWAADLRMSVVETPGLNWRVGDIAGWAIRSEGRLAPGVRYQNDLYEVVFKPDGTAENTSDIRIELEELRGSGTRTITVRSHTGLVKEE